MRQITLFQPPETHSCSYLPNQKSNSLYVDPRTDIDEELLYWLSYSGFRRSGQLLYRPHCPACTACQSVRLICNEFIPTRTMMRVLKRNKDLRYSVISPQYTDEIYELYEHYITQRHCDGDMFPPSKDQFKDFLVSNFGTTKFLLAHQQDKLVACMAFDVLKDGLSAVYCFYDTLQDKRSFGMHMILQLTRLATCLNLSYNYLGYFVEGSAKMNYKQLYQPQEWFNGHQWQRR